MGRSNRIQEPNLTYNLGSQCINRDPRMAPEKFKEGFIEVLRKAKEKYEFELISYCIMDNHIHLIIHTVEGGAPISRIMQYIKSRFARWYNKMMNRIGPFWNERYWDTIVQHAKDAVNYLLWLLWYLGFNPVRAGKCANPRTYKYSSINAYLEENAHKEVAITQHEYFLKLGATFKERVKKFLVYEELYRKRHCIFEWV